MEQIPSNSNNQNENKDATNIPSLPSDSFAPIDVYPTQPVSPVSDNLSKPAINMNTQHSGQQFKLASAEVQGPKPPLVNSGGSKFAMIATGVILIIVIGIGGYYFYIKDNTPKPEISPLVTPVKTVQVIDKSLDSDKDGLPDVIEKVLGTYLIKADTDDDGFNDFQEIKNGYSPLVAGATGKYTSEAWQVVKDKIKAANEGFYEKEFGKTDETADWKTYRNEQYGFEISYPAEWSNAVETNINNDKLITFGNGNIEFVNIRKFELQKNQLFNDILIKNTTLGESGKNPVFSDFALEKIGNENFYYIFPYLSEGQYSVSYWYVKDWVVLQFELYADAEGDWQNTSWQVKNQLSFKRFNQILSAFKFINQKD